MRLEEWAGRWILVHRRSVQLDAAGTLGCFHRRVGPVVWISSSLPLISQIEPALSPAPLQLTHGEGMDWVPGPASGVHGVCRLLPTQVLDIDGQVRPRLPPEPRDRTYDDVLDELESRLTTTLANLASSGVRLTLPLSAGRDSRLLLAAARHVGVELHSYTFEYPGMTRADRELPPVLSASAGFPHRSIAWKSPDPDRIRLFDRHTGMATVDMDRRFFATGQWDEIDEESLDLGGGVFEVGRCYYYGKLPIDRGGTSSEIAQTVLTNLPSPCPAGVSAWGEWLATTPLQIMDWRDRFYLEQRAGCWLSSIGQGLDLVRPTRVHAASCAHLIAALLSIPEHIRRLGLHHDHLIRRMEPALAKYPFNPPGSRTERVRERLTRELGLIRAAPDPYAYALNRMRKLQDRRSAQRAARGASS